MGSYEVYYLDLHVFNSKKNIMGRIELFGNYLKDCFFHVMEVLSKSIHRYCSMSLLECFPLFKISPQSTKCCHGKFDS